MLNSGGTLFLPSATMSDAIQQIRDEIRWSDDPQEKFELCMQLAGELYLRGDYAEALIAANESLTLAQSCASPLFRPRALRMIGGLQEALGEVAEGLSTSRRALRLFRAAGSRIDEATMLLNIAITQYRLGEHRQALECLQEADEACRDAGKPLLTANILMTQARVHATIGDVSGSLQQLMQALAMTEPIPHNNLQATLLLNIGCTLIEAEQPTAAEEYLHRALAVAQQEADTEVTRRIFTNLAHLCRDRSQYEQALGWLNQAMEQATQAGDEAFAAIIIGEIGRLHQATGNLTEAKQFLAESRQAASSRGDTANMMLDTWALGQIAVGQGEHQQAMELLLQALELCQQLQARNHQWGIHHDLAEEFERSGQIQKALEHWKLSAQIEREVLGREQQQQLHNLTTRHRVETAQKEREIARLENEQLRMDIQHKTHELTLMALHLMKKNEALERIKMEVVQLVNAATADTKPLLKRLTPIIQESIGSQQEWSAFEARFAQVHPGFFQKLLEHAHDLSPSELRVAALLRMQMSTKDIAAMMCVTPRAIDKHRLQMRRKLKLAADLSLPTFFASI